MSVEGNIQSQAPAEAEPVVAVVGNPALLGLMAFLPSGITLGLWFVGYLDTANLPGGMIPIVSLSAGLFLLIATVWAGRLAQNTVAAIFGVFSAFWLSFGFLLIGANQQLAGLHGRQHRERAVDLPAVVPHRVRTAHAGDAAHAAPVHRGLRSCGRHLRAGVPRSEHRQRVAVPDPGICTFAFCAVFAYILADGVGQDLGGKAMPMGNAIIK